MFFSEYDYRRLDGIKRQIKFEKFFFLIFVGAVFYFSGPSGAILVGLIGIIFMLSDIKLLLAHKNFMKDQQTGLRELDKMAP